MRIDRINLSVDTDGKTGKVRSASIYFENISDIGERVSGQFAITLEEYEKILHEELLPETIAEKKLVELFAIQPEEDVTAAFVQLSEQVVQDAQNLAVATATDVASAAVEEVKAQAVQAATQVADTQTAMLRTALRKFVRIDELQPEDIADLVGLYDPWIADEAVAVGDIRSYEGKLYKVVQAHTTQADWTPDATPALWTEIAPPETEDGEEIVPLCRDVVGGHDAYSLGEMCQETDGEIYRSKVDGNGYRPSAYPANWEKVND